MYTMYFSNSNSIFSEPRKLEIKILSQYTRPFINKSNNPIFLRTIIRILFTPKEKKYISTKNRLDIFKI